MDDLPTPDDFIALTRPRLGALLRHCRQRLGWSQDDLARATGIDQKNISDIEVGRVKKPWPATLERIAEAMAAHGLPLTADMLLEAARRPAASYQFDDQLVLLQDRLKTHNRRFRRAAYAAFNAVLDAMEDGLHGD